MGIAPPNTERTYVGRLRQYRRRESMILWVGAGLVGLIALVTSDLSAGAPKALNAAVATLIIVGGGALAAARIKFEWAATQLDRAIHDGAASNQELPPEHQPWPSAGEVAWLTGLVCVPVAGVVYALALWWSAIA